MWSKHSTLTEPVKYPAWTIVQVNREYFLILEKSKLNFISRRAVESWKQKPIKSTIEALENYPTWKQVGFSLGSLIKTVSGDRYVICGSNPLDVEYRRVATPDFDKLGFNEKDFVAVSDAELKFHKKGADIDAI